MIMGLLKLLIFRLFTVNISDANGWFRRNDMSQTGFAEYPRLAATSESDSQYGPHHYFWNMNHV